jgi:seryl-tRNA synthetase
MSRAPSEAEWEEEATGVGDPVQQTNIRAKNAASASKAAFGAISELRRSVKDAVQQDKEDHERIYTSMDDVKSKVDKLETKVDKLSDHVGDLREESARTGAHVERMVSIIGVKETAEVKAEVSLKLAAGKAEIADQSAVKKLKRQLFLKFAIPIVTALATAISAYFIAR